MKKYLIAIFCLVGPLSSAQEGQGPWSLQDCVDYALEHNITIRQSEVALEQKEIELNTAKNRRLPGLNASVSENLSFGRGLTADNTYTNSNTTSTSFSLGADIPIFQGFDINNGIKLGKLGLEAAVKDLEKAKDDIRVNVAQAYVDILYNQEMLKVAQSQLEHDGQLLEQVVTRRAAGKASDAEVSAQEAALAQSRLSATQADNNLQLSVLTLTQLLELPSPEGFEIEIPSTESFEMKLLENPEAIYAQAEAIKPAVKSALLNLESAEVSIARAKGAYLPTLMLTGGLGTNYYTTSRMNSSSFADQMKNNFSQYVGLSLSIPIFSRFSTRNSVRNAELNYESQQLQLENIKKSLYKEIQQAYYNAVAAQSKYVSSMESAESARKHYELTEEKYRAGKADIADYNDAKNSWLSSESDFVRSKYECLFQTRLLDFYKGEDIVF